MPEKKAINIVLLPLSWIFGLIVRVKNALFDTGLLHSQKASVKTIVIGNIAVGGSGKTPHVIWLAKELSRDYNIAVLSRGYKRKSKGFHWVEKDDDPAITGDEPLEIKRSLPDIPVAVEANRLKGIRQIQNELNPKPDFIILDDGFQHRKLKADLSIVLHDEGDAFTISRLLPAGRLREPLTELKRADFLILTNSSNNGVKAVISFRNVDLRPGTDILSSSYIYTDPLPESEKAKEVNLNKKVQALLIAGTAKPGRLKSALEKKFDVLMLDFPDHYAYSQKDITKIISAYNSIEGENKILITTGKDLVKLKMFPEICDLPLFCQYRDIRMENQYKKILLEKIQNHG